MYIYILKHTQMICKHLVYSQKYSQDVPYLFQLAAETLVGNLEDIIDQLISYLSISDLKCSLEK